jgi:lysozyme
MMKLSREGAMELIGHEGIVLTRYLDSVGVWTLGLGHTRHAGPPDPETFLGTLTLKESFDLFERDVKRYVDDVNRAVKVKVTQGQFDAMVSFHFNTGAIGRASFVRALNAGDVSKAAQGIMAWVKPVEVTSRRQKEQRLFLTGKYSNGGMANIYPASASGRVNFGKPTRVDLRKALALPIPQPPPPDIPKPKPAEQAKQGWLAALIGALFGKRG